LVSRKLEYFLNEKSFVLLQIWEMDGLTKIYKKRQKDQFSKKKKKKKKIKEFQPFHLSLMAPRRLAKRHLA
jgi:hypothetical protein